MLLPASYHKLGLPTKGNVIEVHVTANEINRVGIHRIRPPVALVKVALALAVNTHLSKAMRLLAKVPLLTASVKLTEPSKVKPINTQVARF